MTLAKPTVFLNMVGLWAHWISKTGGTKGNLHPCNSLTVLVCHGGDQGHVKAHSGHFPMMQGTECGSFADTGLTLMQDAGGAREEGEA